MTEASIVFRNADMSGTGKIYVDKLDAAAELAAEFRNASHFVDVLNRRDEVVYRWEQGAPDWSLGETRPIKLDTPAYRFDQPEAPFWDAENRLRLLIEAIPLAFDTATGRAGEYDLEHLSLVAEQQGDDQIEGLVDEARHVAETAGQETSREAWAKVIGDWMSDSERQFLRYVVEHNALSINLMKFDLGSRVPRLNVELEGLSYP